MRVAVRLTDVPSAPRTSMGKSIRPEMASADPMGIVRAARNRRTSSSGHIFSVHYHDDATRAACNSGLCLIDAVQRRNSLIISHVLASFGPSSIPIGRRAILTMPGTVCPSPPRRPPTRCKEIGVGLPRILSSGRAIKVRFWRNQTKQKPSLGMKHLARVWKRRFWRSRLRRRSQ